MSTLVRVPFHGDELEAVAEDGKVWVGLRKLCENLGVDMSSQLKKLRGESWACMVEMTTQAEGDGQRRVTTMVGLDTVPGWLFTVKAGKVKPEVRDKLDRYKRECARVLADHFFNRKAEPETDPTIAMLDAAKRTHLKQLEMKRQLEAVEEKVNSVEAMANRALNESRAASRTLDSQFGWFSVLAYCKRTGRECSVSDSSRHGKNLTAKMKGRGQEPQRVSDPRFGTVNLYPETLLIEHFGDNDE